MKIEDILEMWDKDSHINRDELDDEALNISKLHSKYYRIFINEKLILRKYEMELKTLKFDKQVFYTEGPNEETEAKGWKLPPRGKIYKPDVGQFVESDKDVVSLTLRLGLQHEKCQLLESIIKSFTNRGFNIRDAISFAKFKMGI